MICCFENRLLYNDDRYTTLRRDEYRKWCLSQSLFSFLRLCWFPFDVNPRCLYVDDISLHFIGWLIENFRFSSRIELIYIYEYIKFLMQSYFFSCILFTQKKQMISEYQRGNRGMVYLSSTFLVIVTIGRSIGSCNRTETRGNMQWNRKQKPMTSMRISKHAVHTLVEKNETGKNRR
jgi:hypothetical protein